MDSAARLFGQIEEAGLTIANSWKVRQTDFLDKRTSHIYQCRSLADLRSFATKKDLTDSELDYSLHRWRNFKRHEAWQVLLFEQVPSISLPLEGFHKQQDFFIESNGESIPFDLKVSRYPRSAKTGLSNQELAEWFYRNQSRQGRFHLANRFFIVGEPESALYSIDLARATISKFVEDMAKFRHFVGHSKNHVSRAVVLRQTALA